MDDELERLQRQIDDELPPDEAAALRRLHSSVLDPAGRAALRDRMAALLTANAEQSEAALLRARAEAARGETVSLEELRRRTAE